MRIELSRTPWFKVWVGCCIAYPATVLTSIAVANVLLSIIVVGWIIFHREVPSSSARVLLWFIGLYLAWTLFAAAVSPFSSNWSTWIEERSTVLAIFPGLVLGSNEDWLRKSLRYVSILLILLAIYAVYQYLFGWDLLRGRPLRFLLHRYHATGLQDFHLTFAGMIALVTPVAVSLKSARPAQSILIALAGALAVISAMARTMILGLIGCGVLFLLFGSRWVRVAGMTLIISLLVLPRTMFTASGERLARGLGISSAQVEQGDPTRIYLWQSALDIIRRYPIAGVGEDNWNAAFELHKKPYDNYSTTAHAHNDFLSAAVDHGIIGAALLAALWIYILYRSVQSVYRSTGHDRDVRLGFLASFLVILFGGMFQNYQTDAEVALLLWSLVGASIQSRKVSLLHGLASPSSDSRRGMVR